MIISFCRHIFSRFAGRAAAPLASIVVALATLGPAAAKAVETRPYNVLLLMADDLNADLGAYGHPLVQTPALDRLAADGVLFERAYCQQPLCNPSRASILTGRMPHATGIHANPGRTGVLNHFREHIPATVTLPEAFMRAGWFSTRIGKLYHYNVPNQIGTGSTDDPLSWNYTVNPRGHDRDITDRIFSLNPGSFGATLSWLATENHEPPLTDAVAASAAVEQLERYRVEGRRFFLAVGFYLPHTPYVAPRRYFEKIPLEEVGLPELSEQDKAREPAVAWFSAHRREDRMTDEQRLQARQAYWASISYMDSQVGRVLEAVERLGFADDTIVVFTSDHGYHLGEHGLWQKRSLFENSARVPLIIRVPGAAASGGRAPHPVELLDLYPTLADLCGLQAPEYLDGISLRPVLDDPDHRSREGAVTQTVTPQGRFGYSIRTLRWRYVEYQARGDDGAARQLFDYVNDPGETVNLAGDPEYAEIVARHRDMLAARFHLDDSPTGTGVREP